MQAYSDPSRESDPYALPDVEVFEVWRDRRGIHNAWINREDCCEKICTCHDDHAWLETSYPDGCSSCDCQWSALGWYWQSCFPGCLPDSDPVGPFDTEEEALADAQQGAEEES